MRTLTISCKSLYLRFFLWVWQADPEKLDICKLFWGTLFFPLGFFASLSGMGSTGFFFKRLGYCCISLAVFLLVFRNRGTAISWFIAGLFFITIGFIWEKLEGAKEAYNKGSERVLNKATAYASQVVYRVKETKAAKLSSKVASTALLIVSAPIWGPIFLIILGIAFLWSELKYTGPAETVGGFIDVVWEYFYSLKQRHCTPVRVE